MYKIYYNFHTLFLIFLDLRILITNIKHEIWEYLN